VGVGTEKREREGMPDQVGYVSTGQAAKMLGCHENTIRNKIERGEIPAEDVGQGRKVYRIPLSHLTQCSGTISPHVVAFWRDQFRLSVKDFIEDFQEMLELSRQLGQERGHREVLEHHIRYLEDELASSRMQLRLLQDVVNIPTSDTLSPLR
jgi:excisionase family DNA binding protein